MKKLGLLTLLAALLFTTSCHKDFWDQVPTESEQDLKDIKVSSSFDWSTSSTIDVNITGLPTERPVYSTLTISLNDGSSLYQGTHEMSKTITIPVVIPANETHLKLKYGTVEYDLPITGKTAAFSFIPVVTD